MLLERVYQGIPISIMGYHWIPWYPDDILISALWLVLVKFPRGLTLSRFAGGRQCQLVPVWCCAGWVTRSVEFYHEKIGHFQVKSIQLGTSFFRRPILGIFFSSHHRKMHQWRPSNDVQNWQVTGYALYLGYVRPSELWNFDDRDGDEPICGKTLCENLAFWRLWSLGMVHGIGYGLHGFTIKIVGFYSFARGVRSPKKVFVDSSVRKFDAGLINPYNPSVGQTNSN